MYTFLALIRGINVGGNALIKMADLKVALEKCGLRSVQTYIQSGNVIFQSDNPDTQTLTRQIENCIKTSFTINAAVVVFEKERWRRIIQNAPATWGRDKDWKHNLLVLVDSTQISEAMTALGSLKSEIEKVSAGDGVVYQSLLQEKFGQTSSSKIIGTPIYRQMTIRNFNTATKLLEVLDLLP